ncbi:MAG: aminotransferase class IV [Bacteroidales bacterium]|nr:aminotransferase class IV [Bacteroidales bacterium]HOL97288.1 aminotransferase class IV [Bacteroidales bacterium]HOM35580.1 aminotransferase class IV [Bacteroidales bacterium]HPD24460.1 aminotransferase class IV [Bacteroidales bacterium]HRS98723.1 aminotransferase class IV [Bacteroidales bacterium]
MTKHIMLNGDIMPAGSPVLHHNSRAIRYGDCFTVVLRGNSSKAFFPDEYFEYMLQCMQELNYLIPETFEKSIFYNDLYLILQKNRIYKGFKVYISFIRDLDENNLELQNTSILISPEKITPEFYEIKEPGKTIDISTIQCIPQFLFEQKYSHLIENYLISKKIYPAASEIDIFLFDENKNIIRTRNSAVFFVKKDKIFIPENLPNDSLKIFTYIIIAIAEISGIKTEKLQINISDLHKFDEVFTADVINGIQYVNGIEDLRYYKNISKYLAQKLDKVIKKTLEEN